MAHILSNVDKWAFYNVWQSVLQHNYDNKTKNRSPSTYSLLEAVIQKKYSQIMIWLYLFILSKSTSAKITYLQVLLVQ